MSEFILMLTRDDRTLPECRSILDEIENTRVRFVGFKDIGVPEDELREIVAQVRRSGRHPVLEVVSLSEEEEIQSIEAALRLEVDYLIGGTRPELGLERLKGSGISYFPYVGDVVGHPARLAGSREEIVDHAMAVQDLGVDGINLLAYRHADDGLGVAKAVKEAVDLPLICAGSVDSVERIGELSRLGVWAFTVGGAVVSRSIVPEAGLSEQIEAVLDAAEGSS